MQTPAPRLDPTLASRLENLSPAKRALLERRLGHSSPAASNPFVIARRHDPSVAPVSFAQEGLLFMEQLDPGTARYNVFEAVRIKGDLDTELVQHTLDAIVERHEALRTVFAFQDGAWQQVIAAPSPASLRYADLSSEGSDAVLATLQAEADVPMDVEHGPLFFAFLARTDQDEHCFLIKMHHIVSDGWSLGLFWKEFASIYSSLSRGERPSLEPLPVQFGDFADWSREYLGREIDRQTAYWTEKLRDAPALLEMPTDRPRPAVQTVSGQQEIVVFPRELLGKLNDFSKAESSTLYMTLLAGFNALVSRYTGSADLIIGTPIAGRNRTEIERLVGYFVNTLVLRTDLSGDPTFRDLLTRVKTTALDAFSHQELPFEKIVAAVSPERSLSFNPIYQVVFALQESSSSTIEIAGLEIDPVKLRLSTSKFDLFLSAREVPEGLAITVEYNTDLFDRETIARFISHYRNLLEGATNDPLLPLSALPLMDREEYEQVVFDWNDTTTEFPRETVHKLFATQCSAVPGSVALTSADDAWTYAELDAWSNQVAHYLRGLGLTAGENVGISMDRSPEMIAAILAILKSGACYVPMDPANPASRLEQMITDSDMRVLIGGREQSASLSHIDLTLVDLSSERDAIEACSKDAISVERDTEDAACVLYTSGSTGLPKGVVIPHRAISRLVKNTNYVDLGPEDRVAHASNVAFDAALFDVWGGLLNGGRLVILSKDTVLSPDTLSATLKSTGVTTLFLTTSLFHLLAREKPDAFESVSTVLVGGESFEPAAARSVLAAGPPKRLLNVYGPTESTTFTTWKEIKSVSDDARNILVGRPLSNTSVYILDNTLNPVPAGVPGEVYIGGDGLALGYLKRPELNAERFFRMPETMSAKGLPDFLYRTGDLARFLRNGEIEYMGRKDHQVKIRGFRIELGEIESVIESHPAIAEAVVMAVREDGDHRLIAYYLAADEASVRVDELRGYAREKLPNYMVPGTWIEVADMALNANGKVDRRRLETLAIVSNEVPETVDQARDELEVKLTRIWTAVLGARAIGVKDNFFDLGGHSLAAVKVFSEIEKTFGCRLPLATLFKAPTIEQLADVLRDGGWTSSWQSLVPVRPAGTRPPFFCVHAVGGNILEYNEFANQLSPDQPFYGLQSIGLDGRSEPLTDIRAMAAAYVREIRELQPHGPYYVGGRSFGGTAAYEIAQLLVAQGEEVALLAIFDSYPKGWLKLCSDEEAKAYKKHFLKLRIKSHLKAWTALSLSDKVSYVVTKLSYKSRKLKNLSWRILQRFRPSTESVASVIRDIEEINYLAVKSYVPETYDGKVTFFCADDEVGPEENLIGWRLLAKGGVDVVDVPGDHQTMIKGANAAALAQKLEESITACLADKSEGQDL